MVKLDEKWKKNGRANPRKDEKEPKHPRDPLQRAKLGLAVLPCQKNDSELAIGVFIGEERIRKQAQAQRTTARRFKCAARRFPIILQTARRQSPPPGGFPQNRPASIAMPTPRPGPPDGLSVPPGGASTLQIFIFLLFS